MRNVVVGLLGVVVLVSALHLWGGAGATAQDKKQAAKASGAEIENLVKQLGSETAKAREAASKALLNIGEDALPFLKGAMKSNDAETRRRAEALHREIHASATEKRRRDRISKATALGMDYLVGRIVRDRKNLRDEDCAIILEIGDALKAEAKEREIKNGLKLDFKALQALNVDAFDDKRGILASKRLSANSIKTGQVADSMVICKELLDDESYFNGSVLLAGKGARLSFSNANDSIVFCNGDFEVAASFVHSILVASGNVKIPGATGAFIIAGGKITVQSTIACVVREDAQQVCEGAGFFSPQLVGLEIKSGPKHIEVARVHDGSAFARAGIRGGDKIMAIDGVAVKSAGEFRISLLDKVLAKQGEFSISRAGADIKATVEFNTD